MNRRALLAKVHIAKKELALDDATYRLVLERVTGRKSAKDATETELARLLDDFKARGWVPKASVTRARDDKPHVRKVWALWGALCRSGAVRNPDRSALRSFVERQTGVGDPQWLSPEQATKVIEGLKAWQRRAKRAGAK